MAGQVFRFVRGAAALQIIGRGNDHLAGVANVTGTQGTVRQVAETQRDIGLAAGNVDQFVA
ncbi:hypothetical protein D3C79_905080 [compost metagenome]